MSFILDALKKSETDRQRQNGPALFEVRVAPPRNVLPLWAIGLAALLAINLVIVAWALLRRPAAPEQTGAPQMATAPTMGATSGVPGGGSAMPQQAQSLPAAPVLAAGGTASPLPPAQTVGLTQSAAPGVAPAVPATGSPSAPASTPGVQSANVVSRTEAPSIADAAGPQAEVGAEKQNPDDYAPAVDPGPSKPFANRVTRATDSGVPLYQDVAAANSQIPNLRLDFHLYSPSPQARFVMINMRKMHEGDSLPNGVRVESITPDGAVMSQNGTKFLLPRE